LPIRDIVALNTASAHAARSINGLAPDKLFDTGTFGNMVNQLAQPTSAVLRNGETVYVNGKYILAPPG
jgi:hypothetical protein